MQHSHRPYSFQHCRVPVRIFIGFVSLFSLLGALFAAIDAAAELVPCDRVNAQGNLDAVGGCISKSLVDQIGSGQGDITLPGSSVYLIKRDPARSVRRGRQLFQRKFSHHEGLGPRVNATASGDVTATRALGAGLADSCAACHGRPRGSAGFGGDVNTFPDSRDAPHLFGLGLIEMLGDEITKDLREIRRQAVSDATSGRVLVEADFESGRDGFVFSQAAFGPDAASGYASAGLARLRGSIWLLMRLGGRDHRPVERLSGGWRKSVNVPAATEATLEFSYRLTQSPGYEPDESSEVWLSVNGATPEPLASLSGDGDGGSINTTGFQQLTLPVELVAGDNTLVIGAFNNRKDAKDEVTLFAIDDVSIKVAGGGNNVTVPLLSKGISFGSLTAKADGSVDLSKVQGIDPDLRVRPFFHDGRTASMREFIIGALNDEMGLQAWDPVLCGATDPDAASTQVSAAGFEFNPSVDAFSRPPACDEAADPDGDGVAGEVDPALVDHLEFYLLNYFKPGQYRITSRARRGERLIADIGCTNCHVQDLVIDADRRVADVETTYDPQRGIFNELFAEITPLMKAPEDDGDDFPLLLPKEDTFVVRNVFTDLKRHDLGPNFAERDFDGGVIREHVTEPLWGVGTTAPYGHDGRSINLDAVIRRHGGEAISARNAYASMSDRDRDSVIAFLDTLVLFPPDDTASSLGRGDPANPDPQPPANHGSINLAPLFQIDAEGDE